MSTMIKSVSNKQFVPAKKNKFQQTSNVIINFIHKRCNEEFQSWTKQSMRQLSFEYFDDKTPPEIQSLLDNFDTMNHMYQLTVFFLLLNIETELKDKIMQKEETENHEKLTRFFLDLEASVVTKFICNEKMSIWEFINLCEETYVLA